MTGAAPANLPAVPTLIHLEQEDEAEDGVPATVREDARAPLDFRTRAGDRRLGVRGGRRTGGLRADSTHRSPARGYEHHAHDGEDHGGTKEPHELASRSPGTQRR